MKSGIVYRYPFIVILTYTCQNCKKLLDFSNIWGSRVSKRCQQKTCPFAVRQSSVMIHALNSSYSKVKMDYLFVICVLCLWSFVSHLAYLCLLWSVTLVVEVPSVYYNYNNDENILQINFLWFLRACFMDSRKISYQIMDPPTPY